MRRKGYPEPISHGRCPGWQWFGDLSVFGDGPGQKQRSLVFGNDFLFWGGGI